MRQYLAALLFALLPVISSPAFAVGVTYDVPRLTWPEEGSTGQGCAAPTQPVSACVIDN